jgi:hypothetical protein
MCTTLPLCHCKQTGDSIAVGAGRPTWEVVSSYYKVTLLSTDLLLLNDWQTYAHALLIAAITPSDALALLVADRCIQCCKWQYDVWCVLAHVSLAHVCLPVTISHM